MSKSFKFDRDGEDGYNDRGAMKRQRKQEKHTRRNRRQDAIPAEAEGEDEFDVMATID